MTNKFSVIVCLVSGAFVSVASSLFHDQNFSFLFYTLTAGFFFLAGLFFERWDNE